MDPVELKGIAWVGNIYQKFEAMCLEVEEAMCQETAKYVENQVQTVGASMKRFCSDVMQDLRPPLSKEVSRIASADLLINPYLEFGIHKKPILKTKEDATDSVRIKGISENNSNPNNDIWEYWSAASFNWEISDKDEADCDPMAVKLKASDGDIECESRGAQERKIYDTIMDNLNSCTKSSAKGGERSRYISNNIIRAESTGSSAECDSDLKEEKDATLLIIEPIEDESELGFEETCVLVDENDYRSVNYNEEIRRSYKKKIQSAFSLKKKPARKLSTHDSLESEWELL